MVPRKAAVTACCAAFMTLLPAQGEPHNGPRPIDVGWFALTNATVITEPGSRLEATTIVIQAGAIRAVGGSTPAGATVIDCQGLTIYPGLIDAFVPVDSPAIEPDRTDAHWSPMIQPQRGALDGAGIAKKEREQLRALGFTTAAATPTGGIIQGTASVVLLDEPGETERTRVLRDQAYLLGSLSRNRNGYPNSEQGSIAMLRQTLFDSDWYERSLAAIAQDPTQADKAPPVSAALAAMVAYRKLPLWFDTENELQILRVLRVAAETGRSAIVIGSGMEFRRLAAIAATKTAIVVPLEFPDAPELDSVAAAESVSLRHLQSWEQAPTNSARLLRAGIEIAWTTARLDDKKQFRQNMHHAMQCGIDEKAALAALTTVPAKLLGLADRIGTIAKGKVANLVVVDGDLFDPKATIRDVWVGGHRHEINPPKDNGLDGTWSLAVWPGAANAVPPLLSIDGKKVELTIGEQKCKTTIGVREPSALAFRAMDAMGKGKGVTWLRVHREAEDLVGTGSHADGSTFTVRGIAKPKGEQTEKDGESKDGASKDVDTFTPPPLDALPTPLGGYGTLAMPEPQTFAIVGAVLWPSDGRGIIRNGGIVARAGKIVFAGPMDDLPALPAGTVTIEADGRHVTPGIIDCHSHTGISAGINESGQAVTAEVRIQDVIDPDDVNWYRQLAGGVTAVNQLHGSSNAIGGQSSTVKLRYGCAHPDDMRLEGAPAGIKWALGENPRRANGRSESTRYPSTRMGVEALIRDRLVAAEAYRREHAAYAALDPRARAKLTPPRRDLELEAIGEIIAGERRIHCHSYRQDEIFMLCGIAQEYGIKIGTFQHVLEGYKVADAIAANAIGASSFSDWWAYKFEVFDAIPENGAILHEAGVSVSFNSDSSEHARRLNTEAGKAVKYGNVDPAEALCFVTRNPAVQLGIFERTGSLTAGKAADVALWSGNPLSYASRCEATWVDGRPMFSLARDKELRQSIAAERARLLQKAATVKKSSSDKKPRQKDAYWAAEELQDDYCCRNHDGGR